MLDKATEKKAILTNHCQSISSYLSYETRTFNLILCLDALIYIRNLDEIIAKTYEQTKPEGIFIFSTEKNNSKHPRLQPSGRYSHPEKFLRQLLDKKGWKILSVTDSLLRKDGDHWIKGNIWIVQK